MIEQWKQINGYPNYQISNLGRIKRIEHYTEKPHPRNKNMKVKCYYTERIKKCSIGGGKAKCYYLVCLTNSNGKQKRFSLHRLVAEAFVPNPNNYNEIDHIDRNPENNRADNLRWVTHVENMKNQNPIKKPRKKIEHSEEFYRNHPNYQRKD